MGFSGRREATRAPTVENATITTERTAVTRADEVGWLSEARSSARAMATKVGTQADHASQEATRALTTPILRSWFFFLPPRRHSTAVPSPERYDDRYEDSTLFRGTELLRTPSTRSSRKPERTEFEDGFG